MKLISRSLAIALVLGAIDQTWNVHADCAGAPAGLIHWYTGNMDGRDSAGTNNGVLEPGVTAGKPGEVGGAFLFNGVNGGVSLGDVPDLNFAPDSSFSIEAWFNSFGPSPGPNDGQIIVRLNYVCGLNDQSIGMGNNQGSPFGQVFFNVRDANGVGAFVVTPIVSSNQFHHVVGVRQVSGGSRTLRIYLDGVLVDSQPDPSTGVLAANVIDYIGRRPTCSTDNVFNGLIDEVSIYNRPLTDAEVQALFAAGSAGKCAPCDPVPNGLVSWYPGEGNGNDVAGPNSPVQVLGSPQFLAAEVRRGIKLDGNSGFVVAENPTLDFGASDSFSLEGWIKADVIPGPDSVLVDKRRPGGSLGFVLGIAGTNDIPEARRAYIVLQDGANTAQALTGPVADTNFHHVAAVVDRTGATLSIYLDGLLQQTTGIGSVGSVANIGRLFIGYQSLDVPGTSGIPFNGIIDELTIYRHALSPAEIQAIVNAGSSGKCRVFIDWFKVAGGGGTSSDATRSLSGTIGQADAGGPLTNAQFSLVGGFWALPIAVQVTGAPTLHIVAAGPGFATISWTPATPGFHLQTSDSLTSPNWLNAPSGSTNPVTVPATFPQKFYRLIQP